MDLLIKLAAFVVAIGVLVVAHEFGHYAVARLCGVKVLRFSIGFGRPLVRWVSAKSGTEWTLCALPLGGYVKMLDERDYERDAQPRVAAPQARASGGAVQPDAGGNAQPPIGCDARVSAGCDVKEVDARARAALPSRENIPEDGTENAAAHARENGAASSGDAALDRSSHSGDAALDHNHNGNHSDGSSPDADGSGQNLAAIPAADLPHAFNRQPVGKRIAIVAAGPLANFVLAIALFTLVYVTGTREPAALVAAPPAQSAAAQAGLRGGETIVAIASSASTVPTAPESSAPGDQQTVRSWPDLTWKLMDAALGHGHVVLVARAGNATRDFSLDLSQLRDSDLDDDFMSRVGLMPGGALQVEAVEAGSPAQRAGLESGDVLKRIDTQPVDGPDAFIAWVKSHAGRPVRLEVERGTPARQLTLTVVPAAQDAASGPAAAAAVSTAAAPASVAATPTAAATPTGHIGAALTTRPPTVFVRYGALDGARLGARRTWDVAAYSVRMFARMVTGDASLKNLSGPVTIADYAGQSARLGPAAFLSFLALVSISLGVLNLLPIPVLDGGYLLYYLVEAVSGKTIPGRWQVALQGAGLACIVALSAIALFNDLARLIHF